MKTLFYTLIALTYIGTMNAQTTPKTIYDFEVKSIDGATINMSKFKGKKLIIVNTASECGNTPQYAALEALYQKYKSKNLVILGFPANNFGGQEPGTDAEIKKFCSAKYAVTFPMMSKISAKGKDIAPIYSWLTKKSENQIQDAPVTWNFQKFLIDEQGHWKGVVAPGTSPDASKELMDFIQK